ncbi:hypothetical protein Bbelb_007220 [Branchiostoma belcheri]|nr:hypothetical protein Bbelb_007220 [Branchiostoma belcheri]
MLTILSNLKPALYRPSLTLTDKLKCLRLTLGDLGEMRSGRVGHVGVRVGKGGKVAGNHVTHPRLWSEEVGSVRERSEISKMADTTAGGGRAEDESRGLPRPLPTLTPT